MAKILTELEAFNHGGGNLTIYDELDLHNKVSKPYPSSVRLCSRGHATYWNSDYSTFDNKRLINADECGQIVDFSGRPRVGLSIGQSITKGSNGYYTIGNPYMTYASDFYDLFKVYHQAAPYDISPRADFYIAALCFFFDITQTYSNGSYKATYKYKGRGWDMFHSNIGNESTPFSYSSSHVILGSLGSIRAYHGKNYMGDWEYIHLTRTETNVSTYPYPLTENFYYADSSPYNTYNGEYLPSDGVFIYDLGRGSSNDINLFEQDAVIEGFWYNRSHEISNTDYELGGSDMDWSGWFEGYDEYDRGDDNDMYWDFDFPDYDWEP